MKLSGHCQRSPTVIEARMCTGWLSELPGDNSECKGEVKFRGTQKPCVNF